MEKRKISELKFRVDGDISADKLSRLGSLLSEIPLEVSKQNCRIERLGISEEPSGNIQIYHFDISPLDFYKNCLEGYVEQNKNYELVGDLKIKDVEGNFNYEFWSYNPKTMDFLKNNF